MATPGEVVTLKTDRRFYDGVEWHESIGGIPLDRVVWDPWPGTATEEDLLHMVEVDKRLVEMIDGVLLEKPMGREESEVGGALLQLLRNWNDANGRPFRFLGADGTVRLLTVNRVRVPDVGAVLRERMSEGIRVGTSNVPAVSPDLVVEVLSRGNTRGEMVAKLVEYFDNGTRLAWYVQPADRTVAVYTSPGEPDRVLTAADTLTGGNVMPGLEIPVARLFEDLDD
ncbi:MAG: Uma2 family endonuclease [Planctomycetota bacterium]